MSLILIIDTCGDNAFVCLSREGNIIAKQENTIQNQHAAFVHPAIEILFKNTNVSIQDIDAVAVVNGPGSYTGLRVGLSSAKGICYSINKPLILINTLYLMAMELRNHYLKNNIANGNELFCPLIDARRMEVYTGIYDIDLKEVLQDTNLIIDKESFSNYSTNHLMVFGGSGSLKVMNCIDNKNCLYPDSSDYAEEACWIASERYKNNEFDSLIYSEPFYLKEFYSK